MRKRIEFIDLAKGICIIMVVMFHANILNTPTLKLLRMPLYFVLSGLFYKSYSGLFELIIKKANRLLVPILAFTLPIAILSCFTTRQQGFDLVDYYYYWQGHYYTTSLWFLLVLFEVNILYALIQKITKSNLYLTGILACLSGGLGYYLITHNLANDLLINRALASLPFLYAGHQLNSVNILRKGRYNLKEATISTLLFLCLGGIVHLAGLEMDMFAGQYIGHPLLLFTVPIGLVISFLMICKAIKYIPYISYVGRYSIVILCVHHIIVGILLRDDIIQKLHMHTWTDTQYGLFVFTIALGISSLCIPIGKRYFPHIFAQKDVVTHQQIKQLKYKIQDKVSA